MTQQLYCKISTFAWLSFTRLCHFCPLHLCLIFFPGELFTRTPLKLFCSLLLASASGLSCHKESASASIHESYTKWARETPGLSDIWVLSSEWAGLAQQLRGPTLCCRNPGRTELHIAARHRVCRFRVLFTNISSLLTDSLSWKSCDCLCPWYVRGSGSVPLGHIFYKPVSIPLATVGIDGCA